jgi:polyisoprenoid-binding protein YceI
MHRALRVLIAITALIGFRSAAIASDFDFKDPKEISAVSLSLDSKLEPIFGYAKGLSGSLQFDPEKPAATSGKIAVEVSSIVFANEGYTTTARGYALDEKHFPQIFLTIRKVLSVTKVSPTEYRGTVAAEFTCKGITLPMTVPVSANYYAGLAAERTNGKFEGDVLVVRTHFAVSRTRLHISEGIPENLVGDSIEVKIACVGIHYAAAPKKAVEPAPIRAAISGTTVVTPLTRALPLVRADHLKRSAALTDLQGSKTLLMLFFSEECGVTYLYRDRIKQLQRDYEPLGYTFVGVLAGRRQHPEKPAEISETNFLSMPIVEDVAGDLVRCYGIGQSVTFVMVDNTGKVRYKGGFDDNVDPKRVKANYLRSALAAHHAGRPILVPEGKAIGCAILPIK